VATAYFRLRQFDYQLDFSQRDVTTDNDAVRLKERLRRGLIS